MTLPKSFDAFPSYPQRKFRRVLIGTEGGANTGKSEFCMGAPGPVLYLPFDASYEATLENPTPPPTRRDDIHFVYMGNNRPQSGMAITQQQAAAWWGDFYLNYYLKALDNPDARSVILDGDSDSFEVQMLAEFGRTTQIPQIQRTSLNAARRLMIARAFHSGKVVIMTNKLKKKYEPVFDASGNAVMDPQKPNEQKRDWDGKSYERQGFNDHEYMFEIQLRHLYNREAQEWGVLFQMCKSNRSIEGMELWGSDCNVRTVLEAAFPNISAVEWGY